MMVRTGQKDRAEDMMDSAFDRLLEELATSASSSSSPLELWTNAINEEARSNNDSAHLDKITTSENWIFIGHNSLNSENVILGSVSRKKKKASFQFNDESHIIADPRLKKSIENAKVKRKTVCYATSINNEYRCIRPLVLRGSVTGFFVVEAIFTEPVFEGEDCGLDDDVLLANMLGYTANKGRSLSRWMNVLSWIISDLTKDRCIEILQRNNVTSTRVAETDIDAQVPLKTEIEAQIPSKQLADREQFLTAILRHIPGLVWSCTSEWYEVHSDYGNRLNQPPNANVQCRQTIHPEDADDLYSMLHGIDLTPPFTPRTVAKEVRILIDGKYKWHLAKATSLVDEAENFKKWVGISFDIDEQKRAKEQALALTRMMSHELRTPFSGVLGNLDLLEDTDLSHEQNDLLHTAKKSTERLLDIINDILNFSKLEAGRVALEKIPFNIVDLLDDLSELMSPMVVEKGIDFNAWADLDVPECVIGDPTRIRQVIVNLVGNAIKFTERGGIRLQCSVKSPRKTIEQEDGDNESVLELEFVVEDTGIGIGENEQKMLFKPFVQADSSVTRKYGGTGLGLSICADIVKLMHGSISCQSIKGRGSTFRVRVPLDKDVSSSGTEINQVLTAAYPFVIVSTCPDLMSQIGSYLKGYRFFSFDGADLKTSLSSGLSPLSEICPSVLYYGVSDIVDVALLDTLLSMNASSTPMFPHVIICLAPYCKFLDSLNQLIAKHDNNPNVAIDIIKRPLWRKKLLAILRSKSILNPRPEIIAPAADGYEETVDEDERILSRTSPELKSVVKSLVKKNRPKISFDKKALIAEDNIVAQKLLVKQLSKLGIQAVTTCNGEEAVQKYRENGAGYFDIAIFDHHMPLKDGIEAAKEIREMEDQESVSDRLPIVGLTADIQATGVEAMNCVWRKPIGLTTLAESLQSVFGNT